MPEHYFQFGEALTHPLFSGVSSFWDGLYSTLWLDGWCSGAFLGVPSWNYPLVIAGAWLGLLPTLLIFLGLTVPFIQMLREKDAPCDIHQRVYLFTAGCLMLYFLAMLHIHLTTPIYSSVKSSYFLSILPCIALTALRGFQFLEQRLGARLRNALYAALACWALVAYGAYFSLAPFQSI